MTTDQVEVLQSIVAVINTDEIFYGIIKIGTWNLGTNI